MYKNKKINLEQKEVSIIFLVNAIYYDIDWAMIVFEKEDYRLLVHYQNELTTDKRYSSPDKALKDFKEIYKDLKLMDKYELLWRGPYEVEQSFITKKLRYARKRKFIKKITKSIGFKIEQLILRFGWGKGKRWSL